MKNGAMKNVNYVFDHIGVPTKIAHPNEKGSAEKKQFSTDPNDSPIHIEYLRFLPGCDGPQMLMTRPHIAFYVNDIKQAAKEMDSVVFGPFCNDVSNIIFCMKDGLLMELMQKL